MTETTEKNITLSETEHEFILRWGDMGTQWGVNRSVAQIHALLYVTGRTMNAEEICETLGIARSNVSNSLKELQNWQLIERHPINNDRRDHFLAVEDVMTLFRKIVQGRLEREIKPAVETLERCATSAKRDPKISSHAKKQLEEMRKFVTTAHGFYSQMEAVPNASLMRLMKMGSSILKFLPGKKEG